MSTLEQVVARSQEIIDVLAKHNKAVTYGAQRLVELSYKAGVEIRLTAGHRTLAQQAKLYNQGRFGNPGKIVTNAEPGESYHNYALAIDFVLTKGGYDMTADNDHDGIADWLEVVSIAKSLGFEWGGDWKSFKDYPHFQITFGLSIRELQQGRRPTPAQIANAIVIMNGMERDTVMEEKVKEQAKAIDALTQKVTALEKKVNVSGNQNLPGWAEKAVIAAKKAGAITKSNDKSHSDLITIQMLYNLGLFNPGVLKLLAEHREEVKEDENG